MLNAAAWRQVGFSVEDPAGLLYAELPPGLVVGIAVSISVGIPAGIVAGAGAGIGAGVGAGPSYRQSDP